MDRITVQPMEVRGLGDIVSPKSASDFEEYLGTLSSGTDTVNGASMTVYTLAYASNVDSVSLTSNKSILSYADSESATLSATVLDSDSEPLENVTVEFFKGTTSLGTADTNSSGVATKTYASAGAGDLSFTAKVGSLVSETYAVQDCYVYDTTEHNHTQSGSTATSTSILNNFTWDNTNNWEATFDLKVSANAQRIDIVPPTETRNHHLGIGKNGSGNGSIYVGKATSGENYTTFNGFNNHTYYPIVISKTGTSVTFKFDGDTISQSYDSSWLSNYNTETIMFTQWGSGTIYIKNIKIKRL